MFEKIFKWTLWGALFLFVILPALNYIFLFGLIAFGVI